MTDTILDFDKPTQKKFIKEVESGTPIKEAVKKVDPEQKRKENDERIRREIERERELREKTKFSTHVRKFHDITKGNGRGGEKRTKHKYRFKYQLINYFIW
jgi:hypothetical protein